MSLIHDRVKLEKKDGIAYVTLSRPDKYNGLDFPMMEGLVETARLIRKDRELRAVILQGDGKAFCAGLDFGTVMKQPVKLLRSFTKYGIKKPIFFRKCAGAGANCPSR